MREPRVVFVNRYFYPDHSATSQLLSDLAFHLAAQGTGVTVVTGTQVYDDPAARLLPREVIRGVEVRRVRTTRFGRDRLIGRALDYFTFYLSAAWTLLRLLRRGDILVAKTDPPLISIIAAAAARARGARLVNWVQDLFPEVAVALGVRVARLVETPLRVLRNWSFNTAQRNVAIGDGMARRILDQGIAPDRVAVIHNWCSAQGVRPLRAEEVGLRKAWDLEGRFVVGYSGNMGRAHEFGTLLAAARLLRDTPAVILLFIGAGAQRPRVEAAAARDGLANIVFRPYQPLAMLKESLSVPDVHLISLQPELEGCIVPSKFYGIAAAGRPVIHIGRRDGEIGRLIVESDCGYVVEPGDAAYLAAIVRQLAADPVRCHALGMSGRRAYEIHFERDLALERWAQILMPARRPVPEAVLSATVRIPGGEVS